MRSEAGGHWLQTHIEVSRAGVCVNESPMTAYRFCGFVYLTAAQRHTATTTVHSLKAGGKLTVGFPDSFPLTGERVPGCLPVQIPSPRKAWRLGKDLGPTCRLHRPGAPLPPEPRGRWALVTQPFPFCAQFLTEKKKSDFLTAWVNGFQYVTDPEGWNYTPGG